MNKQPISYSLRKQVFERDRYTCRYCGYTGGPLHADHVYPESKGGETTLENLSTACPDCNMSKSDKVGIWPLPIDQNEQFFGNRERYFQSLSMFVYYALIAINIPLQDRIRGIKATFPKLTKDDIAIISGSSPSYVSQVLQEVDTSEVGQGS
jgi:HNH endonuclease